MSKLENIKSDLRALANKEKAKILAGFFKTGPGQYGEGDIFLGVMVPQQRKVAKKYCDLSLSEAEKLLHSKEHEFRLTALLILVDQYKKVASGSDFTRQKEIFDIYLANTKWINNWDLVDLSAPQIVGSFLVNKDKVGAQKLLAKLAHSKNLWERRVAIISTFAFIRNGDHKLTFEIARLLLKDKHDLIHKAVGWMLREVGKRCGRATEMSFLNKHHKKMPRTTLRYAVEHFTPPQKRKFFQK